MPANTDVLCAHCGRYMSRNREREHRRLIAQPYVVPPLTLPSRIRQVTDDDSDGDVPAASTNVVVEGRENGGAIHGDADVGYVAKDHAQPDRVYVSEVAENALRARWADVADVRDDVSDNGSDEELPYPILEDDGPEPGFVDWEAIETNYGLSAWDQLGEGYERDAAAIGKLQCNVLPCFNDLRAYSQSS